MFDKPIIIMGVGSRHWSTMEQLDLPGARIWAYLAKFEICISGDPEILLQGI